jgi:hypothetical protein
MKRYLMKAVRTKRPNGQTMTEYAMIVSAVAAVALLGYREYGSFLEALLSSILIAL